MKVPFNDLIAQYHSIQKEVDEALSHVLEQGCFIGGESVSIFEKALADYLGVAHGIGCANGTDALEIALEALGIRTGDEVIVPALTWTSTASAVSRVGAQPVFADVLANEKTIDPESIRKAITDKTKAIIPVHLYGQPARMSEIISLAQAHDLLVIEDCAQALGAAIAGKKVGTFGHVATISFYPTKNLGAYGDAGAIVTDDAMIAETCRRLGDYGRIGRHDHQMIGRNSRLDALQAAILSVKMKYLDQWLAKRTQVANAYDEALPFRAQAVDRDETHAFHQYVIRHERRDVLRAYLQQKGIGTDVHYPTLLPFLQCFQNLGYQPGHFPVGEKLVKEIVSLPIYPEMGEEAVAYVISTLGAFE